MGALEAQDFIDGLARRQRPGWEQARELMRVVASAAGARRFDFPLPWDKEAAPAPAPPEAGELEALRRRARAVERRLAAGKGADLDGANGTNGADGANEAAHNLTKQTTNHGTGC